MALSHHAVPSCRPAETWFERDAPSWTSSGSQSIPFDQAPIKWLLSPAPWSPHSLLHRTLRPWGSVLSLQPVRVAWYRRGVDVKPGGPGAGDRCRHLQGAFRKWGAVLVSPLMKGTPLQKMGKG